MQKFDPSCGLSRKEIGIIKYGVKHEIGIKLPLLPDSVETKIFLQGRVLAKRSGPATRRLPPLYIRKHEFQFLIKITGFPNRSCG